LSETVKECTAVVTRKGQITIPVEIRRSLGISEGDRVAIVLDGDEVRLAPSARVVARTAGMLKAAGFPLSAEELRQAAERAIAEEAVARSGD
jgi:antitoxin PrlF